MDSSDTTKPLTRELQILQRNMTNTTSLLSNAGPVREKVNKRYIDNEQQDAVEFLADLLTKLQLEGSQIPQFITGIEGTEERCKQHPHCSYHLVSGHDQFHILQLSIPEQTFKSFTFNDILEHWFSFDRPCPICGSDTERHTIIRCLPHYLFISFNIFHGTNNRSRQPLTGYVSNNVVVARTRYKTIGAICHIGETTRSGHYWCLLQDQNKWLYINDTIIQVQSRFVNNLNNVYLLLLEKFDAEHINQREQ